MKKTNAILLLTVGVLGVAAFTTKITAADSAMPSCCGGAPTETVADTQAKPDLLATCPVSGEKLGEMGAAFTFVYQDQQVNLCCKSCKTKFDKNPEKYIASIRAADKI
jgi:YHS domain-containing protein